MWSESAETPRPLRTGLTTGSCATACALVSARLLLTGQSTGRCDIELPKAKTVDLPISQCYRLGDDRAYAAAIKDAGDDPDVTHGAGVFAVTTLTADAGVRLTGAKGVGTVTCDGLPVAVGEPAINPVPRRMINAHLQNLATECGYGGGFEVAIGIEGGEKLAQKTMNPRLGILGGLSVLGTTGIVRPFSCAAYIASIHQGIDVARARGLAHIAACTGNISEAYARGAWHLEDMALVEMGDFVGAVLKYLKKAPIPRVSLVGGFGKFSKLACGHLDLHSRASSVDRGYLADHARGLGATDACLEAILAANTSGEALRLAAPLPLADAVCRDAWRVAQRKVPSAVMLDLWAIDSQGGLAGHHGDERLCPS